MYNKKLVFNFNFIQTKWKNSQISNSRANGSCRIEKFSTNHLITWYVWMRNARGKGVRTVPWHYIFSTIPTMSSLSNQRKIVCSSVCVCVTMCASSSRQFIAQYNNRNRIYMFTRSLSLSLTCNNGKNCNNNKESFIYNRTTIVQIPKCATIWCKTTALVKPMENVVSLVLNSIHANSICYHRRCYY